jgi:hypothetical protein
VLLFSLRPPAPAVAQSAMPKLKLNAELVLTADFCTSELKRGNWGGYKEKFSIGEKLCPLLESELPSLFASMKKSDHVPAPNATDADVVLVPKVGDIGATAGRKRELVVVVEWTALDRSGKTLWVQTIQATGQGKAGSAFSHGKNMRLLSDDAVKDALAKSEEAIRSAPLKPAQ